MLNDAPSSSGVIPRNTVVSVCATVNPIPRFILPRFPRVVPDQRAEFQSGELFKKLSIDSEIRYIGHKYESQQQRQLNFYNDCRQGKTEIAFTETGTCFELVLNTNDGPSTEERDCDFNEERGKVHIKSHFIMNGVCVIFRGRLDLHSLEGAGRLEYDKERAIHEAVKIWNGAYQQLQSLRDFVDMHRS